MAGRGTDIHLGEGMNELGGLHVIMTERHDARRIDQQLAGRSRPPGQSRAASRPSSRWRIRCWIFQSGVVLSHLAKTAGGPIGDRIGRGASGTRSAARSGFTPACAWTCCDPINGRRKRSRFPVNANNARHFDEAGDVSGTFRMAARALCCRLVRSSRRRQIHSDEASVAGLQARPAPSITITISRSRGCHMHELCDWFGRGADPE